MGTRSLTHVKDDVWNPEDEPKTLVTIYRQYDGYPTGMGKDLASFLSPFEIVNGFGVETAGIANGMGCLAAQLIKHLKDGVGNVYIYPADSTGVGEEYVYTVYRQGHRDSTGGLFLKVEDTYSHAVLYDGPVQDFDAEAAEGVVGIEG